MTAKEYLKQINHLDAEIDVDQAIIDRLRLSIGIRAQPDPNENVGHSGNVSDPVSDTVVKIMDLENQLNRKIDKLINLKQKIINQIDGLENRYSRNILKCKYVLGMTWRDVAMTLNFNEDYCKRELHSRALQEFERKYLKTH